MHLLLGVRSQLVLLLLVWLAVCIPLVASQPKVTTPSRLESTFTDGTSPTRLARRGLFRWRSPPTRFNDWIVASVNDLYPFLRIKIADGFASMYNKIVYRMPRILRPSVAKMLGIKSVPRDTIYVGDNESISQVLQNRQSKRADAKAATIVARRQRRGLSNDARRPHDTTSKKRWWSRPKLHRTRSPLLPAASIHTVSDTMSIMDDYVDVAVDEEDEEDEEEEEEDTRSLESGDASRDSHDGPMFVALLDWATGNLIDVVAGNAHQVLCKKLTIGRRHPFPKPPILLDARQTEHDHMHAPMQRFEFQGAKSRFWHSTVRRAADLHIRGILYMINKSMREVINTSVDELFSRIREAMFGVLIRTAKRVVTDCKHLAKAFKEHPVIGRTLRRTRRIGIRFKANIIRIARKLAPRSSKTRPANNEDQQKRLQEVYHTLDIAQKDVEERAEKDKSWVKTDLHEMVMGAIKRGLQHLVHRKWPVYSDVAKVMMTKPQVQSA